MAGPRDPHNVALAQAIQKLRNDAGLTQQQLADRAEIPLVALQQVEAANTDADWGTLRHIASGLGTSLADLFQLVEELEAS
jgi:transcriptional regulator with XRE-family HTH domain